MSQENRLNEEDNPASPHGSYKKNATYAAVPTDEHSAASLAHKSTGWVQRIVLDTWIPEIIAIVCSAACLAAIIIVLAVFQNRMTPQLPWIITLNAVVAILATASRSMLVYVVATSVGQLKWCWYQKKRTLSDLQTFDSASRGPWGSIDLLVNLRAKPLASIGALIMLLALAFDPFVQQVLTYPNRLSPDSSAVPSLSRALQFAEAPGLSSPENITTTTNRGNFAHAFNKGLWSRPDAFEQQPICPTGNCTWPIYSSIGWCSKCQDVTASASLINCTLPGAMNISALNHTNACSVDLGSGLPIQILKAQTPASSRPVIYANPTPLKSVIWMMRSVYSGPFWDFNKSYLGVVNPILALGHVKVQWCPYDRSGNTSKICITAAEQCVLSLCERSFASSVTNGNVSNVVKTSNFGVITPVEAQYGTGFTPDSCWQRENTTTRVPSLYYHSEGIFCPNALLNYQDLLAKQLLGNISQAYIPVGSEYDGQVVSSDIMEYINATGLDNVLEGIAASLTSLALEGNTTVKVPGGQSFAMENYVSVAWAWFALPICLELGAIVVLIIAIVESRRYGMKLWKSSILPLLYFGLQSEEVLQNTSEDVSSMAALASGSEVKLAERPWKGEAILVRSRR